jgi:hypothetical protein
LNSIINIFLFFYFIVILIFFVYRIQIIQNKIIFWTIKSIFWLQYQCFS